MTKASRAQVQLIDRSQIERLISPADSAKLFKEDRENFEQCLLLSSDLWAGLVDGKIICIWGLIPPSLLSDNAHLWLYTLEAFAGFEFIFVRHSQRVIEEMLHHYPIITGHTNAALPKAIRWLEWLGAKYEPEHNGRLAFTIRAKQ